MERTVLSDKILKLIVEEINVTRADQISKLLNVNYSTVLSSLKEMEKSGYIKLMTAGTEGVYVVILKPPGRQFYKTSGFADMYKQTIEEEKPPAKSFKQIILGFFKRRSQH